MGFFHFNFTSLVKKSFVCYLFKMYVKTVLQGNFVKKYKRESTQRKLSRPLVVFFSASQVLFGYNFGFMGSSGKLKLIYRFITTTAVSMMIATLYLSFTLEPITSNKYPINFIQYIPFFLILRAAKYTLRDFITDSLVINEKFTKNNDKVGVFLWLYASIMFGAKIATSVVYFSLIHSGDNKWLMINTVIHVAIVALDIIPIANFVIFYYVYSALKDLRVKYEHRNINLNLLRTSYVDIANSFEKIRSNYDAIFVWGFITESGKWMIIIWNHLILLKNSSSWWLYGCSYTWSFFITVQNCLPAVCAEMISVQNDAIKMILQAELLVETDETKTFELTRLLRYVEARPFLRKAWRLVPVDLRQPVTMLSICTTYLIVIIQFSHLFD